VGDLLDADRRMRLDADNRRDQDRLRALHGERQKKPLLPLANARENRTPVVWHAEDITPPAFVGTRLVEAEVAQLRRYIDWTYFFHAWELKGRYPSILEQPAARELFDDATELLATLTRDRLLTPRGIYGFWPASADGDDIVVDGGARFPMLRQQA